MQKAVKYAVFLFTPTFRTWPCQHATDKSWKCHGAEVPNTNRTGTGVCQELGTALQGMEKMKYFTYEIQGQVASEPADEKTSRKHKREYSVFLKNTLNFRLLCKLNNYIFTYRPRLTTFLFLTGQKVFSLLWWKNTFSFSIASHPLFSLTHKPDSISAPVESHYQWLRAIFESFKHF